MTTETNHIMRQNDFGEFMITTRKEYPTITMIMAPSDFDENFVLDVPKTIAHAIANEWFARRDEPVFEPFSIEYDAHGGHNWLKVNSFEGFAHVEAFTVKNGFVWDDPIPCDIFEEWMNFIIRETENPNQTPYTIQEE